MAYQAKCPAILLLLTIVVSTAVVANSMASQGSQAARSSSALGRNSSQGRRRRTTYYCGERPVLATSSTAENPGQKFWGCVNFGISRKCNCWIGEECGYFVWVESKQERQVARLKRKIAGLKGKATTVERMLTMAIAVALVERTCAIILLCEKMSLTRNGRFFCKKAAQHRKIGNMLSVFWGVAVGIGLDEIYD
ncbi:hypothetical protein Ahy_A05g025149 [Arachis hypogaea]|uniref:Zinc finger GRF-type domain-containing protein n=1 Tax=Arachis hypogaea TaxID=3818 RepID=A0A445D7Q3_ARAHY|nr:hypothetical protein Ahy_A05g025149 [Arachis hypogaea]